MPKVVCTIDINIYPLSSTRLTSPYQLTHDTGTSPQSSDSQSAVRQEHSGWAVFIQQEAVYHQLITTYNHMYSYHAANLTDLIISNVVNTHWMITSIVY